MTLINAIPRVFVCGPKENNANADATATHRRKLPRLCFERVTRLSALRSHIRAHTPIERESKRKGEIYGRDRGGQWCCSEWRRDVLSVNQNPRPLTALRWYGLFYLALLYRIGERGRLPRTLDFKRYPFSFYYLPSSFVHRAPRASML